MQAEGHVLEDVQVREQGKILEHQAEAALVGWHALQRGGIPADLALIRVFQPGDERQHGRFAAAAGAEQGDDLALVHLEGDAVNGACLAVGFVDIVQAQAGHAA